MSFGATRNIRSTIQDTSGFSGLPSFSGFISSSAQIASDISGSFTSGYENKRWANQWFINFNWFIWKSRYIVSITGDGITQLKVSFTGKVEYPIPTDSVSGSAQIAADISGSFTSGFEFDNSISGSATSTGSFNRLNFNSLSVTDVSGITGHEAGHKFKCNCCWYKC